MKNNRQYAFSMKAMVAANSTRRMLDGRHCLLHLLHYFVITLTTLKRLCVSLNYSLHICVFKNGLHANTRKGI